MVKIADQGSHVPPPQSGHHGACENLGRALLATAGIGLGVFLYLTVFAKADRMVRAVALAAPSLTGLVAAKMFRFSKPTPEPSAPTVCVAAPNVASWRDSSSSLSRPTAP